MTRAPRCGLCGALEDDQGALEVRGCKSCGAATCDNCRDPEGVCDECRAFEDPEQLEVLTPEDEDDPTP